MKHELKAQVDLRLLHRCLDVAFMCSSEPFEMTAKDAVTPEPYFRSAARQKLYALWRYGLLLVAESQLVPANGSGHMMIWNTWFIVIACGIGYIGCMPLQYTFRVKICMETRMPFLHKPVTVNSGFVPIPLSCGTITGYVRTIP